MITIFNRQELITIVSQQKFFRIREALASAGIESYTKTHGSASFAGARSRGIPFVNQDAALTYTLYVRREEYHRAVEAMQSALR